MSAKRRPEGRLTLKPGAQSEAHGHCGDLYDVVRMRPRLTCCRMWPLCLDRISYQQAVDRSVDARILMAAEGSALLAAADRIYAAEDDIAGSFREALVILASATTPLRARHLARWTPFDPKALRRVARLGYFEVER